MGCQGTLLFLGLLLLLWVPLLVFSSGNPTYQVPEVTWFGVNASIVAPASYSGVSRSFPLFSAGDRRCQSDWAGNKPLPDDMQASYTPDQVKLLCVSQASTWDKLLCGALC